MSVFQEYKNHADGTFWALTMILITVQTSLRSLKDISWEVKGEETQITALSGSCEVINVLPVQKREREREGRWGWWRKQHQAFWKQNDSRELLENTWHEITGIRESDRCLSHQFRSCHYTQQLTCSLKIRTWEWQKYLVHTNIWTVYGHAPLAVWTWTF